MRPIYFYFIGIIVGIIETTFHLSFWRAVAFNLLVILLIELLFVALKRNKEVIE